MNKSSSLQLRASNNSTIMKKRKMVRIVKTLHIANHLSTWSSKLKSCRNKSLSLIKMVTMTVSMMMTIMMTTMKMMNMSRNNSCFQLLRIRSEAID